MFSFSVHSFVLPEEVSLGILVHILVFSRVLLTLLPTIINESIVKPLKGLFPWGQLFKAGLALTLG